MGTTLVGLETWAQSWTVPGSFVHTEQSHFDDNNNDKQTRRHLTDPV